MEELAAELGIKYRCPDSQPSETPYSYLSYRKESKTRHAYDVPRRGEGEVMLEGIFSWPKHGNALPRVPFWELI